MRLRVLPDLGWWLWVWNLLRHSLSCGLEWHSLNCGLEWRLNTWRSWIVARWYLVTVVSMRVMARMDGLQLIRQSQAMVNYVTNLVSRVWIVVRIGNSTWHYRIILHVYPRIVACRGGTTSYGSCQQMLSQGHCQSV